MGEHRTTGKEVSPMTPYSERIPDVDPAVAEKVFRAVYGLENYVKHSGLEPSLLDLVRLRASQINGCAYCIDMHTKDARARGESEQRLYLVSAWQESPFYSERERAALLWTEAVTLVADGHVPDAVYTKVREAFNDEELLNLTVAVAAINVWNRLNVAFRTIPGSYEPATPPLAAAAVS